MRRLPRTQILVSRDSRLHALAVGQENARDAIRRFPWWRRGRLPDSTTPEASAAALPTSQGHDRPQDQHGKYDALMAHFAASGSSDVSGPSRATNEVPGIVAIASGFPSRGC